MTNEEIDSLEAGCEMDEMIAENVMGVTTYWHRFDNQGGCRNCDAYVDGHGEVYGGAACVAPPSYSTSIADAWLVVERMATRITKSQKNDLQYLTLEHLGEFDGYAASFGMFGRPEEEEWWEHVEDFPASARGDTVALAICRAALKAAEGRGCG